MTEIKSVTCPICGCLCDDIEVTVENNEIVKMKNGCALSAKLKWFTDTRAKKEF